MKEALQETRERLVICRTLRTTGYTRTAQRCLGKAVVETIFRQDLKDIRAFAKILCTTSETTGQDRFTIALTTRSLVSSTLYHPLLHASQFQIVQYHLAIRTSKQSISSCTTAQLERPICPRRGTLPGVLIISKASPAASIGWSPSSRSFRCLPPLPLSCHRIRAYGLLFRSQYFSTATAANRSTNSIEMNARANHLF
jgi:hypothetical protein